jgi:SecD/SecF fusion protein
MTTPARKSQSAQTLARKARSRSQQTPPPSSANNHFWTGILLFACALLSVFVLWKPFAPRTEYLAITPKTPVSTANLTKALVDTGALPNPDAIKVNADGLRYTVVSNDTKNPIGKATWTSIAKILPSKLPGAVAEFRADPPSLVNLGLDLRGGLRVVLQVKNKVIPAAEDLNQSRSVIENRVNQTGVAEPLVQISGNNRIVVELPGLTQAESDRAIALVGKTAKLEFRLVKPESSSKAEADLTDADMDPATLTGEAVAKAQTGYSQLGAPEVQFEMTPQGSVAFEKLTGDNPGRRFAIVLDGKVQSAPRINQRIAGNGVITGNFTLESANDLALVMRSGSLKTELEIVDTRAIGPTLGQDAIRQGILASLVGVGAVVVMLFLYYGLFYGLVAALGLVFSGLLIFGMLSGLGSVLTLPGIAGLVLTIGAAVDGNVISFERIKEEMRTGKSMKSAINAGFGHSFTTIFDVNASHLLSALALFNYATGPVKGFAVTLAVGVIGSTFSNLIFSKWFLEILESRFKFRARDWFATPKLDFMGLSKFITTASAALAVIGLVIILTKGFVWGVDFTSGTSFGLKTNSSVSSEMVRNAVGGLKMKDIAGQDISASGTSIVESQTPGIVGKDFTVRVGELSPDSQKIFRAVLEKLPNAKVTQTETVGPAVGGELRQKTIEAVLVSLLLTLVYVAFRFDVILGVGSVVAVLHDVFIVMGLYALLGREFTITSVAAVLTLVGYSLNDSIIVSDRIRENLKLMRGAKYSDIVNASINQTLSRTIMTSVATMLPLIALLFLGGPVLRDFSLVLLIGILVGTYSSIYIVAPMAVFYKNWQESRRAPGKMAKT